MSGDIRRDRQAGTAIDRQSMTARTTALRARRAGVVLRVIELHVEGLVEARRKIFQWRIVAADVGMTDLAHRHLRRGELAAMTIRARFVSRKTRRRGIVGAFVTRVAGEGTVTLAAVNKLRVIVLRRGGLEKQKYARKGAKPQRKTQRILSHLFASLRLCVKDSLPHLISLRLIGGLSAIR
jgi:hypothetical protein